MFKHVAIREFYSLLRSTMRVARGVNLLRILINEDIKVQEDIEEAFWWFVDQK